MLVGLHDAEREHMPHKTFPNLALMKISAYHKARGDKVEWWQPFNNPDYGAVYSSKIFTFTLENDYLPPNVIKGGTGYDAKSRLPQEIENCVPDYSIYPDCYYMVGFVTRGCPNACPWCVVPEKEGGISPYRTFKEVVAWNKPLYLDVHSGILQTHYTNKVVLMDNNILACDFGISQLAEMVTVHWSDCEPYRIDINQGLDARLVTPEIADILARIRWIKYIRFACDTTAAVAPLMNAVRLLNERGIASSRIFVYFLVRDIPDAIERVRELRGLGAITLYAQAYRDLSGDGKPVSKEAYYFATKYIYSGQWRKTDWYDTPWGRAFKEGQP